MPKLTLVRDRKTVQIYDLDQQGRRQRIAREVLTMPKLVDEVR
jgi:hypothetical protein